MVKRADASVRYLTLNCHLPSNGQEIRRDPTPQFPQ